MSDKKNIYPQMASAPAGNFENNDFFQHRGPPPSYEESQRQENRPPPPNYVSSTGGPNPSHMSAPKSFQYRPYATQPAPAPSNYGAHSVPFPMGPQSAQSASAYQVLEFDSGARFKGKGAGAITIPPPPPGCAPTPAQLAALQGHPVILKKKKNSYF